MRYRLKRDLQIYEVDSIIKTIPKGTILEESRNTPALYESKDPVMCIGISWIENNPNIFEEVK